MEWEFGRVDPPVQHLLTTSFYHIVAYYGYTIGTIFLRKLSAELGLLLPGAKITTSRLSREKAARQNLY